MTRYYRKEIPEMPVYVNGVPLKFEVLETADQALIDELDKCITHGRGGIAACSKEEFEVESKKKPSEINSESGYRQNRQRLELSALSMPQNPAAGEASGVSISPAFAAPQFDPNHTGRVHNPNNRFGLPNGANGPAGGRPMPDPIELPAATDFKPPTAKMTDILT